MDTESQDIIFYVNTDMRDFPFAVLFCYFCLTISLIHSHPLLGSQTLDLGILIDTAPFIYQHRKFQTALSDVP